MITETKESLHLGTGRVYFDRFDADGERTGEMYLGETPSLALTTSGVRVEIESVDGAAPEVVADIEELLGADGTLVVQHVDQEALALLFGCEHSEIVEPHVPQPPYNFWFLPPRLKRGHYYRFDPVFDIGRSFQFTDSFIGRGLFAGPRPPPGSYRGDASRGELFIHHTAPDRLLREGVTIVYRRAGAVRALASCGTTFVEGALRYIEDNVEGGDVIYTLPHVELEGGDVQLKQRTEPTELSFTLRARPDGGRAALYRTVQ